MMDDEGTFWSHDSAGDDAQSSIDKLLAADSVDLEQVLSNDEVIQECKYMNSTLTEYLARPEVLEKLIRYTVQIPEAPEPSPGSGAGEGEVPVDSEKFPYVASELFACEVSEMLKGVFENDKLLDLLFSFLSQTVTDPRNSGYFRKVVGVLIQRNFDDLKLYLSKNPQIIVAMAKKVGLYVVMELLTMIADHSTGTHGSHDHDDPDNVNWLAKSGLVSTLVDQIDSKRNSSPDAHENASNALIALIQGGAHAGAGMEPSALVKEIETKEVIERLSVLAMSPGTSSSSSLAALKVVNSMVLRVALENAGGDRKADASGAEQLPSVISAALKHICPKMVSFLVDSKAGAMPLQYGTLKPPLGMFRLELVKLVMGLARCCTELKSVSDMIVETGVLKICLKLVLDYPFNNLLHNMVRDTVCTVLQHGASPIRDQALIKDAKLFQTLLQGFEAHQARSASRRANRMGYTGHFIYIANLLENCKAHDPTLEAQVNKIEGWNSVILGLVTEENKAQATTLGGRKPTTHLQDSDDEEQTMGKFGSDAFGNLRLPNHDDTEAQSTPNDFDAFVDEWGAQNQAQSAADFEAANNDRQNAWGGEDDGFDEFGEDPFASVATNTETTHSTHTDTDFDDMMTPQGEGSNQTAATTLTTSAEQQADISTGTGANNNATNDNDDFFASFPAEFEDEAKSKTKRSGGGGSAEPEGDSFGFAPEQQAQAQAKGDGEAAAGGESKANKATPSDDFADFDAEFD
mmetsp:Transcript_4879/g.8903  ORF Transcript_4879/g.8903 Transcript_4879/m.8903 type:complete len:746 (+) Transcript_4879:454-2691(+)|eukprot:CAMPEP_0197517780 /NCGR_PEP_ID=MMETSP1318-20131121/2857_1 /TAXON_ID=552666 /ORGANISM="Partenskyella glossopodia, Strain RCC365" /LENGTH=745 /DNA_ID=CAMNT_0043067623 /DNA_START=458 /DNA_END=2695 /DNA_ORIENTATION=-